MPSKTEWEFSDIRLPTTFKPRYNIAPTQLAPILRLASDGVADVELVKWGFKSMQRSAPIINARGETVTSKPTFSKAFRERRCLVLAHGYYEWQKLGTAKQPWHFHLKGDGLMPFAGLWTEQENELRFTIITGLPNPLSGAVHDRMPIILARENWMPWLDPAADPEQLKDLLAPHPAELMEAYPVTPKMNSFKFDDPECIKPIAAG